MKKILLSMTFLAGMYGYSQDIAIDENCSSMTIGNLGTSLTGTVEGQNGWLTFVSTSASPVGSNSDFQVVDGGALNGNSIQITGSSGTATTNQSRILFKSCADAWSNRTSGNDIVQIEYDFYTGPAVTTKNTFRNYIFTADGTVALAGFYFEPETKKLSGWAQYDNSGTVGYYLFYLGEGGTDLILEPDTWYRVGVALDYNTGDITWRGLDDFFAPGGTTCATVGSDIGDADFRMVNNVAGNTASSQVKIDNIKVSFVAVEDLLTTNNSSMLSSSISVLPNPTSSVFTVASNVAKINTLELTDLNGRIVKSIVSNELSNIEVNISDLSSGIYMMKIVSDKGTVTKKVVKE